METWGYCQPCTRWFHCPKWFDKAAPQPVCPVCGSEPTAIQNRQAGQTDQAGMDSRPVARAEEAVGSNGSAMASLVVEAEPRTEIRGLCPKCGAWFCCDDWFDQSVPLPCCPQCRLAPTRLQYHWWSGGSRSEGLELDATTSELWIG